MYDFQVAENANLQPAALSAYVNAVVRDQNGARLHPMPTTRSRSPNATRRSRSAWASSNPKADCRSAGLTASPWSDRAPRCDLVSAPNTFSVSDRLADTNMPGIARWDGLAGTASTGDWHDGETTQ